MHSVRQAPKKEAGKKNDERVGREGSGSRIAMRDEAQDQKTGDDGVMYVDKPDGEARQQNRSRQPVALDGVRVRFPRFRDADEKPESGKRQYGLRERRMLK